ncbi:cobaltochelatase subunit CobN [Desulfosarcina cetonica]|uniref:cobaltochelatase subunit CobN n=1 Tax=Desulfosarcina cetonica TaxID=90730 RepID=UPI0006D0C1A5|nr:cobaltochelatase subunit CobN [Desulfosarcina cetonica]
MISPNPIRIVSIMWGSYLPTFLAAAEASGHVSLSIFSQKEIENDAGVLELFWQRAARADVVFLYWTADGFWEEVNARLDEFAAGKTIITTSFDPANWGRRATVEVPVCARAYAYLAEGGVENYRRLLDFIAHQVDPAILVEEPVPLPWQGILHPPDQTVYPTVEAYRQAHPAVHSRTVGLFFSRHTFTNTDGALEAELITALTDRGVNVLPVFSHGVKDTAAGALGPIETAERFFLDDDGSPRIQALINLHFFFLGREPRGDVAATGVAAQSVEFFSRLNVPVVKPVVAYSQEIGEWEENPQGLLAEVTFGIAMPEFEGNIEPIIMPAAAR